MKVSHQWLQLYFNQPFPADGVAESLTDLGLEVEEIIQIKSAFSHVVVGEVLEVGAHPNADRLSICQVIVGEEAPLNIVCGAKNVRPQLRVAVALVGAQLPNNVHIKKSKIRDVVSEGMLCASQELGLLTESDGIMELPNDAPIGQAFDEYVACDDTIWDLSITPNRSDCLSHLGIARELAIQYADGFLLEKPDPLTASSEATQPVTIVDQEACPVYVGMMLSGINPEAKTPLWLSERLHRCGIRSIHPVVDVTNYMMLAHGQPMHAFDANTIEGEVQVRRANAGESVTLLSGETCKLSEDDLLITNSDAILALAGVMGAADTQVSSGTTELFLESAYFAPDGIRKTAAAYGLHTESSHRFERGIDPTIQQDVLIRAAHMIQAICGGECGPIQTIKRNEKWTPGVIKLDLSNIPKMLGIDLASSQVVDYLKRLQITVHHDGQAVEVFPPSYRVDLSIEADVIEELARVHGYNNFPTQPLNLNQAQFNRPPSYKVADSLANVLSYMGYQETIHYAFISAEWFQLIHGTDKWMLSLANPLSDEYAVMRQSLWPGLLKSLVYNTNRQAERVRLFEMGTCFTEQGEVERIAGVIFGDRLPKQWGVKSETVDFYDMKNHVGHLLQCMNCSAINYRAQSHHALHPHQSVGVFMNDKYIGMVGRLSPVVQKKLKISGPVVLFELDLTPQSAIRRLRTDVSDHPTMQRDLALVVPSDCDHASMHSLITTSAGPFLKDCYLFDLYKDPKDDSADKNMAFSLVFRAPDRTLTDEEVSESIATILQALETQLHIKLRH